MTHAAFARTGTLVSSADKLATPCGQFGRTQAIHDVTAKSFVRRRIVQHLVRAFLFRFVSHFDGQNGMGFSCLSAAAVQTDPPRHPNPDSTKVEGLEENGRVVQPKAELVRR